MENYNRYKSVGRPQYANHQNPSFSSSLLDQIYRSIDDQPHSHHRDEDLLQSSYSNKKKKLINSNVFLHNDQILEDDQELTNSQKNKLIVIQNSPSLRNKSAAGSTDRDCLSSKLREHNNTHYYAPVTVHYSSSGSSSGSSYGWTESETNNYSSSVSSKSSFLPSAPHNSNHKLKPIRTSFSSQSSEKSKHECGGFMKSKSKASKISNGDLKKSKMKPPVNSPGGRLATFLNSLFTTTTTSPNDKKAKLPIKEEEEDRKSNSVQSSTCSSASSFSRSCLSKTPSSSRQKLTDGIKRSVKFNYPVSTILLDDNNTGSGHDYSTDSVARNLISEEIRVHNGEKNRRVEAAARELLKKYQRKIEWLITDYDEDEDVESCASSDLFELDNLDTDTTGDHNIEEDDEMYCEELPVYETTYFDTNRAIANGLIM